MDNTLYVLHQDIEKIMVDNYKHFQSKTDFFQAFLHLYQQGRCTLTRPPLPDKQSWSALREEEFRRLLGCLPVSTSQERIANKSKFAATEDTLFPTGLDVFAMQHFPFIDNKLHTHDYFELNYVYSGSCLQLFDSNQRTLTAGELCIIAPGACHDIQVTDASIVLTILLRKSTFDTVFFALLTQNNLLSQFFRNILYPAKKSASYLLFQTDNQADVQSLIKDIFMESYLFDDYSNSCVVSRMHLLFGLMLRRYSSSIQFRMATAESPCHADFAQILQYIQHNYQHLTLTSLAAFFHYSDAYLSKLIKKITGETFVNLITRLRMTKATDYLLHTDLKIEEIASLLGYDSSDHFSRKFKKYYGCPPSKYKSLS